MERECSSIEHFIPPTPPVVEDTWATPLLQRPLELGADLVVHSLTKYVGGHSDVMAGAVVVGSDGSHLQVLNALQRHRGVLPSPFDCWLALRGTASLPARSGGADLKPLPFPG